MDPITAKLLSFALVLTRISAFFLVLPVFGWKTIPIRIRVSITILVSVFFAMLTSGGFDARGISGLEAGLLIADEAIYGLSLGLIAAVLFSVVKFSGRIIERQMGLAMAQTLDPLTGERTQPLGMLLEMLFIVLFLAANGHHLLLLVISRSYETFPLGSTPTISVLANGVIDAGSVMFTASLRLAAPMLVAFLLLMVILAVLARMVPEINILFISLPLRVGLGLLMAALFLPLISGFFSEFADWMGKLLPL
ncbi:MAG: flagellar biosynthetic protein FliR [Planctomycetota bacterium]|jgi:flagellar biosynthetic protein FliR